MVTDDAVIFGWTITGTVLKNDAKKNELEGRLGGFRERKIE